MASLDAVFVPAQQRGVKLAALAATTSSAERAVCRNCIVAISATGDYTIRWGQTGMSAADADDFLVPSGVIFLWDASREWTHFRVFNPAASAIDVHYTFFSRT